MRRQGARPPPLLGPALLGALVLVGAPSASRAQGAAPADPALGHRFEIAYRGFGAVEVESAFISGPDYDLRPEGCYAKASPEAVCGFTLRARRPIVLSNLDNPSHAVRADGVLARTCCVFAAGSPEGYPLTAPGVSGGGVRALVRRLAVGETLSVLLRVPDYAKGAPLASVVFSCGAGDPGLRTAATVRDLASSGGGG